MKKRKLELPHSAVKTKTWLDEVKKKCKMLEEEMQPLAQEEARLNTAKAQDAEALDELKWDLPVKLAKGKKIS